jgi:glutaredoxin
MDMIESIYKRYTGDIVQVKGSRPYDSRIFAFTLSTCMWCTLGKKWLNEKGYDYAYLDVDKIPVEDKNQLKAEIRELTGESPRYPFLVLVDEGKWHSGYDSSKWEALLGA